MDNNKVVLQIPIENILPNRFQPRLAFDDSALSDLAASIKVHGIIQPLVVRRLNDKYEIIAGERRYRAAKIAGLVSVPAIISELSDGQSAEVAIVENVQRKDLTAIEEAKSYKALLDKGLMNQEDLARKMGLSQSAISNKLRLLSLTVEVQDAILNEQISERHARSLLKIKDQSKQNEFLNKIITERLTVKMLEEEIKKIEEKELPIVNNEVDIDEIKNTAVNIIPPAEPTVTANIGEPSMNDNTKTKYPNKFFNFLEDSSVNMEESKPPAEEIELLDFIVDNIELEESKTVKEIKEFINKYPNIITTEEEDDGFVNITIKIPK